MDMFSALAEPTRRNIIELLATRGQLSATDIADRFPASPPAISQHLRVLRETRIVGMEKQAQKRLYSLHPDALADLEVWTRRLHTLWNERFNRLDTLLKSETYTPGTK